MNGIDFIADTNFVIYLLEGKEEVKVFEEYSYAISFITEIELLGNLNISKEEKVSALILKTSRLSYTVCSEFIGWDFIRESVNSQEFLKNLSNELEILLINTFTSLPDFKDVSHEKVKYLMKSSKAIVFSFAFTSVTVSDVRKNFISFEKEILPYLIQAVI